jgi:hypothetical protein
MEQNIHGSYDFNNATTLTRAIGEWCGSEPAYIGAQMTWLTEPCGIIDEVKSETALKPFYEVAIDSK